jgi:8-oxo-dGTP pyrophosphatase MutT (NUDIX family)
MDFRDFIEKLSRELTLPLPGKEVQLRMTSNIRIRELMDLSGMNMENAIKSSVLILLYPGAGNGIPAFVVRLRPTYDGVHSGQISLPGGRYENHDEDLLQTALRETDEEIGVDKEKVTVIGKLTELYIPPSNYIVQPFIGYTTSRPVFSPQPEEVEQIIEIPLHDLLDERNRMEKEFDVRGIRFKAPAFVIGGNIIWGATAMILSEFKEILQKILS